LKGITAIAFEFEDEDVMVLGLDNALGGLRWIASLPPKSKPVFIPDLEPVAGLYVGRSWGMINQQRVFDALQMEFLGRELRKGFTLQFQARSSRIAVLRVV
jgi:hypothetical protein